MLKSYLTEDNVVRIAESIIADIQTKKDARAQKWYAFAKANDSFEDSFLETLISLFERQKKEVLFHIKKTYKYATRAEPAIVDTWLFGFNIWKEKFENESKPIIKAIVATNGSRVMSDLPVTGISFDVRNENVVNFVNETTSKYSTEVLTTASDDLRKTLIEGIDKGEQISELRKRVESVYNGYIGNAAEKIDPYKSLRIARTETTGTANFATQESYKQSGVVEGMEWLATLDGRVRDSHAMMDGEVVGLDETFSNDLEFPGDPSGDPAETCNCRCTTLPTIIQ